MPCPQDVLREETGPCKRARFLGVILACFPVLTPVFAQSIPPASLDEQELLVEAGALDPAQQPDDLQIKPAPLRAAISRPLSAPLGGSTHAQQHTAFFEGLPPTPERRFVLPFAGSPMGGRGDFWFMPVPVKTVAFAGLETNGRDHYSAAGFKRAVTGHLDIPGYRIMVTLGAKLREVDPTLGTAQHRLHAARLLGGHEWHVGSLAVSILAGGSFVLSPPSTQVQTHRAGQFGATAMVDLWQDWGRTKSAFGARYTALTAMVDQASRSSFIRLRQGFEISGWSWRIGPEIAYSTGETILRRGARVQNGWRRARLGAMVSDIPFWEARLTVSGGMEWQHDRGPRAYLQISGYRKF